MRSNKHGQQEEITTYSPDNQVASCKKYCQERGWKPKYVIVEDDTRADFYRRPRWLILLLKALMGLFDVLVCWKTDRWARSLWDTLRTEQFLARHGIAYVSVTEPFDTTTPYGRFMFRTIANFAQLERELISERITAGFHAKVSMHRWPNHVTPLGYVTRGYREDPKDPKRDFTLEICPPDVPIILRVWSLYEERLSGPAVAEALNEMGDKTKWGGEWDAHAVYRVLDNQLYQGRWTLGGLKDTVEALRIMPDEDFDAMQQLRKRPIIRRPPQSPARKQVAIRRVFAQYGEQLLLEEAEKTAEQLDDLEAEKPPRLDPEFVARIMNPAPEHRAFRKNLAEMLTM